MTGVFLIIILAVVWYVAGIFHSFALMLYVAVNLLLIAGMYILTRIYKRNVAFYSEALCCSFDHYSYGRAVSYV